MTEKQKEKESKTKVEWSFSFEDLGEKFTEMFGSVAGDTEVKTETHTIPLDGAKSAQITLAHPIGRLTVQAGGAAENLLEGDFVYVGELVKEISGGDRRTVVVKQKSKKIDLVTPIREAFRAFTKREDLRWDIRLNPNMPVALEINGGVGASQVDLTGVQLTRLELDGGVGETRVTLPVQDIPFNVDVDGGVGQTRITVPSGTSVNIDVDGGVGATDIYVPSDAAVRVKANSGIGGINLPEHFDRIEKGEDFIAKSGVWETPGYALAAKKININYDGGVGRFSVRVHETA